MLTRRIFQFCVTLTSLCGASVWTVAQAESIVWRTNLDSAKVEAAQTGKLVLLHFWTPSCGPCQQLDRNVFSQPQIGVAMEKDYVPVKINADMSPALASAFRIDRVPSEVVLTSQGTVVASLSCPPTPDAYQSQLVNVASHFRQQTASQKISTQPQVNSAYAGLNVGQQTMPPAMPSSYPAGTPAMATVANTSGSQRYGVNTASANTAPMAAPPSNQTVAPSIAAGQAPGTSTGIPTPGKRNPYVSNPASAIAAQPAVRQPVTAQSMARPVAQVASAGMPAASPAAAYPSTSVATAQAVQAVPPQLPPGSPPLAFEGYCPVTLKQARKWIAGNLQFGAIHRGRTYLFTGEQQRQQFLANPDAYSPVFSGMDAVMMLEQNQAIEGSRKFGYEYRGAFYLFSNQETMARFASQPDHYAAGVRQAMNRFETPSAGGTIRR